MQIQNSEELGSYIRSIRKFSGLTQSEVAASCGVGLRFYREVESGKSTAQIGKILLILRVLKISLDLGSKEGFEDYFDV